MAAGSPCNGAAGWRRRTNVCIGGGHNPGCMHVPLAVPPLTTTAQLGVAACIAAPNGFPTQAGPIPCMETMHAPPRAPTCWCGGSTPPLARLPAACAMLLPASVVDASPGR